MGEFTLGFIGMGEMACAMIEGFKKSENVPQMYASKRNEEKLHALNEKLKINATTDNSEVVKNSDIVFICVKPKDVKSVLIEIKNEIENQLIVSIAVGVKLKTIESILGGKMVVRLIPNIACKIGEMAAVFSLGKNVGSLEEYDLLQICGNLGKCYKVEDDYMEIASVISGCGLAHISKILQELINSIKEKGLSSEVAESLTNQMFLGTAKLLNLPGMDTKKIIDTAATPGGSTQAGLDAMEKEGIKNLVEKTLDASIKRNIEMGQNEQE